MFRDAVIAAIRTGVAFVVTWLIATLTGWGAVLEPEFELTLNAALFGAFIALYNLAVGLLERKVHPMFGVLLGVPKAPAYGDVGTQTPPPAQPMLGGSHVRTDRGTTPLGLVGLVVLVVGVLLLLLDLLSKGLLPLGWCVLLIVVGALLWVFGSRTGRPL